MDTIPARGQLLDLAVQWWLTHMQRDPDHITAVVIDGDGLLYYLWEDDDGPQPYVLPLIDLHHWNITGQPTKRRSL
jgi:hypothetical protein